jgi:integrase
MALLYTDAIDRYLGDLARRGKAERTCVTYRRCLDDFNDSLPYRTVVNDITKNEVRRFLDRFNHLSPATRAQKDSILRGHFKWLYFEGELKANPMERMLPPKRQRDEDKDVLTISTSDVMKMLEAAQGWTEKLTIGILAYTGARRSAASNLRVSDWDPVTGKLRFVEKGSKTIWKTVPKVLAAMIEDSLKAPRSMGWKLVTGRWVHRGYRDVMDDDYLIPSATSHRNEKRDNRVIEIAVRNVSQRTKIKATPHTFRAAYAVNFLERYPGDIETLRVNMGHQRPETTQIYLRRLNRDAAMERNRDFDYNDSPANSEESLVPLVEAEKEGFEPSIPTPLQEQKASAQPGPKPLLSEGDEQPGKAGHAPENGRPSPAESSPLLDDLVERIQTVSPTEGKAS